MLTCEQLTDLLLDRELGELAPGVVAEMEAHDAVCPNCVAFARTYGAVPAMVRDALTMQVTDELQAELDAAVLGALGLTG